MYAKYTVFSLLPQTPKNNPLFDRKNADIGLKAGPICQFNITMLKT